MARVNLEKILPTAVRIVEVVLRILYVGMAPVKWVKTKIIVAQIVVDALTLYAATAPVNLERIKVAVVLIVEDVMLLVETALVSQGRIV
jgi:hypothetical protein